jgi:hypothetical protein
LLKNLINDFDKPNEKLCNNFTVPNKNQIEKYDVIQKGLNSLIINATQSVYKYAPKDLSDKYSSHAIPLTIAALITQGDILELGMGKYSTHILNKIARDQNRFLLSVEIDRKWMKKFRVLNDTRRHLIIDAVSECANTINSQKKWGLVFVDHLNSNLRKYDVINYALKSQMVVVHDTERQSNEYYGYDTVYKHFKYHCKYSLMYPDNRYLSTSLLSNFISFDVIKKFLVSVETSLTHIACDENF